MNFFKDKKNAHKKYKFSINNLLLLYLFYLISIFVQGNSRIASSPSYKLLFLVIVVKVPEIYIYELSLWMYLVSSVHIKRKMWYNCHWDICPLNIKCILSSLPTRKCHKLIFLLLGFFPHLLDKDIFMFYRFSSVSKWLCYLFLIFSWTKWTIITG